MGKIKNDSNRAGLALGITFTLFHLIWLIFLFFGFGDLWYKWSLGLNFVKVEYELVGFDPVTAIVGLIGAFVVGYLAGFVFSYIWKLLSK